MKLNTILLVALWMLSRCSNQTLSKEELELYVQEPEHGLLQQVEKGNTRLQLMYKPKDLMLEQHLKGITDPNEISKITSSIDSLDYFVLRLSRDDKEIENTYASNPPRFNEVINYLSYYMANDIKMISANDTLDVLDLAYARAFGAAEATSVLLAFNSKLHQSNNDVTIIFDDTLMGTGTSEFNFDINKINNTPRLKPN